MDKFHETFCNKSSEDFKCLKPFGEVMGNCLNMNFSSFQPVIKTIVDNFCSHHLSELAFLLSKDDHKCVNSHLNDAKKCFEVIGNLFDNKSNPQKFQIINEILTTSTYCEELDDALKCLENSIKTCTTLELDVSRLVFKGLTSEAKCDEKVSQTLSNINSKSSVAGVSASLIILITSLGFLKCL